MYDKIKARAYALEWALGRSPDFADFENLGGDCTNFISQCLFAGSGSMCYDDPEWFFDNLDSRSPSWSAVNFLYDYLINNDSNDGVKGSPIPLNQVSVGDIIQLNFDGGDNFAHSLFVSNINYGAIFVCAHSFDAKNRPLSSYFYKKARAVKIY